MRERDRGKERKKEGKGKRERNCELNFHIHTFISARDKVRKLYYLTLIKVIKEPQTDIQTI